MLKFGIIDRFLLDGVSDIFDGRQCCLCRVCRKRGKGLVGKICGLFWIRGMLWEIRTTASIWNVPKKYGPQGRQLKCVCLVRFAHDG